MTNKANTVIMNSWFMDKTLNPNIVWYISTKSQIKNTFDKYSLEVYSLEEIKKLRWHIDWALYAFSYRPELRNHKVLLERIRNTKMINLLSLENDGSKWYVIQISDICIKFKNQFSNTDFEKEIENHLMIEDIYKSLSEEDKKYFGIPWLEKYLSNENQITMEYIPWFTLSTNFVLKDKNIKPKDIYSYLINNNHIENELTFIIKRLLSLGLNQHNIFKIIKEHELKTILIYMWIDEEEFEDVSILDNEFLIDSMLWDNYTKIYKKRKNKLKQNKIEYIDDHGNNLKIYNCKLYGLDFGNITFNKK